MSTATKARPRTIEEVTRHVRLLVDPDGSIEIRAWRPDGSIESCKTFPPGTDPRKIAIHALTTDGRGTSGVFATLNPGRPDLSGPMSDEDVIRRRLLLVDLDPKRPADTNATDAEKEAARLVMAVIRAELALRGWPEPLVIDSGNGYHLVYAVDLPNDEAAKALVHDVLKALGRRFNTGGKSDGVKVDTAVANASRVAKVAGTTARKGPATPERPHRPTRLLEEPDALQCVPVAILEELAAEVRGEPTRPARGAGSNGHATNGKAPKGGLHVDESMLDASSGEREWFLRSLDNVTGRVANAREGDRHEVLKAAGMTLFGQVHHGHFTADEAEDELRHAARRAGLPGEEIDELLEWTREKGTANPLPLPDKLRKDREERERRAGAKGKAKGKAPKTSDDGDELDSEDDGAAPEDDEQAARPGNGRPKVLRNFRGQADNPKYLTAAEILAQTRQMTGGWPRRTDDGLLFYPDATRDGLRPGFLAGPSQLFAFLAQHVSVVWGRGWASISREVFYEYARQAAESFASIQAYPHWPEIPGAYYLHDPIPEGGTTGALDEYLDHYTFASPIDRELGRASILTPYWGGPPGQRPAIVFTTEDRAADGGVGHGKTTFAHAPALGRTGFTPTISRTSDIDVVKARLLSAEGMRARQVILDNVKSLRLSSEDIESLVTAPIISGKRMYHGEASIPNLFGWVLTVNDPALSRDMARRGVPIRMGRAAYSGTWTRKVETFLRARRPDVLRDVRTLLLSAPAKGYAPRSRWGTWELEVLAKCNNPEAARDQFLSAQDDLNEDARQAEAVREQFLSELAWLGNASDLDPSRMLAIIPVPIAADWLNRAMRKAWANNAASRALKSFRIAELSSHKGRSCNVWVWRGSKYEESKDQGVYALRKDAKGLVTYTFKPGATVEDVEDVEDGPAF